MHQAREKESLGDYISCFKYEVVTIPSLQQEVVVLTLMKGLKEGTAFISYLGHKKLTILTKVLGKANKFIRGEEFDKATTSKQSKGDGRER